MPIISECIYVIFIIVTSCYGIIRHRRNQILNHMQMIFVLLIEIATYICELNSIYQIANEHILVGILLFLAMLMYTVLNIIITQYLVDELFLNDKILYNIYTAINESIAILLMIFYIILFFMEMIS